MNTPPCFAQNDGSLTLQRHARKHAHKGGSGVQTLHAFPPPVQHPNPDAQSGRTAALRAWGRATSPPLATFSGGGSWADPL